MRTLKAGALYFVLVFGTGFVLRVVRVLWIVPRLGTRTRGLVETPFMRLAVIVAAWWVVWHFSLPAIHVVRLSAGFSILGFLLLAEFTVVLGVGHLKVPRYLAGRGPVARTVSIIILLVFTAAPLLVARR